MSYLMVVIILGVVILVHELGHFVAAKAVGIPIRIFSVGFGPKLFGLIRNETEYRISLIPLGGYVLPAVTDESDYFKLAIYKRIVMSAGGPLASLLMPVVCLMIINILTHGFMLANVFWLPFQQTAFGVRNLVTSLPAIFQQADQLSGIVGIVSQGGVFIGSDPINALNFTAFLSLNLFVLNMLPIPVLDGGKILMCLMEKINPKLSKLHVPLAIAGWVLIMGLMVYVTLLDVRRLLT
jgi:regulator of sigma E protease